MVGSAPLEVPISASNPAQHLPPGSLQIQVLGDKSSVKVSGRREAKFHHSESEEELVQEVQSGIADIVVLTGESAGNASLIRHLRVVRPGLAVLCVGISERECELVGGDATSDHVQPHLVAPYTDLRRSRAVALPDAPTVLAIDDDPTVLHVIVESLARSGVDVVGAQSGREGLKTLRARPFQILITDLRMPGLTGEQTLGAALSYEPDLAALILTAHASLESSVDALRKGAVDYLQKPVLPQQINESVQAAFEKWRTRRIERLAPHGPSELPDHISLRERQVLHLIAWGFTSREAAAKMGVRPKTVDTYRERLMRKMNADSRSHLVRLAIELGFTRDPPR